MYIGAFDIGGTKTIVGILDQQGNILKSVKFPTVPTDCYAHLDKCMDTMRGLLRDMKLTVSDLEGIGVTLPGIVDSENGILVFASYEKWENISVSSYISEHLQGIRVVCENDVNACAIGEQMFGFGNTYKDYVWITVSTGVGGAVVNDSKLIRGSKGYAGEIGHLKVEYEHPELCPCGQCGCLETHGSGTALNRMVKKYAEEDKEFCAALETEGVQTDGAGCAALAKKGNKTALHIFRTIGRYLGKGISYYANILNPQAVIIGGGVSASLDLLLPGIRESIESQTFKPLQNMDIVATKLGYEAALEGAAALVLYK